MKILIGTKNGVIEAAAMITQNSSLQQDIIEMLESGMLVQVIEATSVTIGKRLIDTHYELSKLPHNSIR